MIYSQTAKRSIHILCKRLRNPVQSGHCYSTSAFTRNRNLNSISELRECKTSRHTNPCGVIFRRYCSEALVSEQVDLIKQLTERTSAPMNQVKAALVACDWDIDAAQKDLGKRGVILASKKSSRTGVEGLLALAQNENKAAIVELNCETDFVARNDIFQSLASSLANLALLVDDSQQLSGAFPIEPDYFQDLKLNFEHPKLSGERTVQNAITEVAAMMGEKVQLRRGFAMSRPSYGVISTYLHASPQPGLGRIAGIVSLEVEDQNAPLDALRRVGPELAMHVVASKPLFLTKEFVSSDAVENEEEILKSQAEASGKPQMSEDKMVEGHMWKPQMSEDKMVEGHMWKPQMSEADKMVEGHMQKYFEDVVQMEQKFDVHDSVIIKILLSNLSKEVGSPVKIGSYLLMEVGEGLQGVEADGMGEAFAEAA